MTCATCGHEEIEHEEDTHHGMVAEAVPGCLACIHEIRGTSPKDYEPAFHAFSSRDDD